MSKVKDYLKMFTTTGDYNRRQIANDRGLKRPFVLKVSGMQGKIPQGALPGEEYKLKMYYLDAFLSQKLQETFEEFAKSLEKELEEYKKDPGKQISKINYEEYESYKSITNEIINTVYRTEYFKLGKEILDKYNAGIKLMRDKQLDEVVRYIKEVLKDIKKEGKNYRIQKQERKDYFEYLLKQVNYGIKLAKKYGELRYAVDSNGKIKGYEYDEKWYKHKGDIKLSYERRNILHAMEKK